jgi:hypothetical protein
MSCPYCGFVHKTTCPRIKSLEYHPDGVTVKRITFHDPQPLHVGPAPGSYGVTPRSERLSAPSER